MQPIPKLHHLLSLTIPIILIFLAIVDSNSSACGDIIHVENPSFEANPADPGTFPVLIPQGWNVDDPHQILDNTQDAVGVLNPSGTTFFANGVPDGNQALLIYLAGDIGGGEVSVWQSLDAVLLPNLRYRLSVAVGNIASGQGAPPFNDFYDLNGFPGYRIELRAGGQVLAADHNSLFGQIPEGTFADSIIDFVAPANHPALGANLEIWLTNLNIPDSPAPGIEVDFDHVRLTAVAVPEPHGLICFSVLGTPCLCRRNRFKNTSES
jgi:hypothetical protein